MRIIANRLFLAFITYLQKISLRLPLLAKEFGSEALWYHRFVVRRALKRSSAIITISEWTKKELADAYGVPLEQMVVTPLSHDVTHYHPLESTVVEEVLQKYRLSRKNYFLSIGRLERKKNIPLLIRAFEIFKRSRGTGDPFELVLIGMSGFGFEEIHQAVDCSPFKESIRPLGWVEEVDIPALMNGTFAYVFPSRYEGFGISNVEAMACGIPLLTSDIPAHREVVRDAGLFAYRVRRRSR